MVSLVVAIDRETRKIKNEPQITVQGVSGIDPLNGIVQNAREMITDAVSGMTKEEIGNKSLLTENLRLHLKRFIQRETGSKPVIVSTIVEV